MRLDQTGFSQPVSECRRIVPVQVLRREGVTAAAESGIGIGGHETQYVTLRDGGAHWIFSPGRSQYPKLRCPKLRSELPIPVTLYRLHQCLLSRAILLRRRLATLAWTLSSAKSFFEFGKRLVTHQWSPYSVTLRERGNLLRIRWYREEVRETIDALRQRTNRMPQDLCCAARADFEEMVRIVKCHRNTDQDHNCQ